MDPHSIVEPAFWRCEKSWLFESGRAIEISAPPTPSVVFATSGSTGLPRFIALAKESLLLSAKTVNDHCLVDAESVWGLCLPWWHVGGFGVLARAYERSASVAIFSQRWSAKDAAVWLTAGKVTHLSLVPTQVHDLVSAGLVAPPTLQVVIVGGGRLEQELGEKARVLGWPVLASYGMTEACSQIATQDLASLRLPFSLGPMPVLPCWQARTSEQGNIEISGPALFLGECHRDGDAWRYQKREGGWYQTQDCGEISGNRLLITHRADSLVKVLGELVNPSAIESTLHRLGIPLGRFAVMPLMDARQQHRLALVHENLAEPSVAAALARYHDACPGYERISEVIAVPAFPRSDLGKIQRRALWEMIISSGASKPASC
jgi:o-succinylbenzoate---CoA ligase